MKTAYSYVRFSSLEQRKGASAGRQIDAAIEWCKNNGYTLSQDHFLDEGKSAYKGKHLQADGDLKRFLALVESGRIRRGNVLVLEAFDRISRLPMSKAVSLFFNIINAGIGIVFTMTHDKKVITEKTIDEEQHILYAILGEAQRAYSESKHKSERVKDAYNKRKLRAQENGFKSLAWCPPWCDFDKEQGYTVNDGRAKIVRRVYDEYLKGNGPFRISRMFNAEKIPTLGHRGFKEYKNTTAEWYKKTVRDFLFDKRVYGYCEFLDKENYYPRILSKAKFHEAQNRLALRAAAKRTGGPVGGMGNLFTGLCRCAHCNEVMSKTATRKRYKNKTTLYEYLVCDGARSGRGCSYKSIPYNEFERSTLDALRVDTFHNLINGTNPTKEIEDRLAALRGETVANQKQIEKLRKSFLAVDSPPVTLMQMLSQFEARQIELSKTIQLTTAQLNAAQSIPGDAMQILKDTDELRKTNEGRLKLREALRSILDKITLDTATHTTVFHFKSGFVGNIATSIAEETEDEETGIVRVKITGSANVRIEGNKVVQVTHTSRKGHRIEKQ